MKAKNWAITTSGTRSIRAVAKDLAAAGLKGTKVLEAIGVITGAAPSSATSRMRKVAGVAAVEEEVPIDIGPPDSSEPS